MSISKKIINSKSKDNQLNFQNQLLNQIFVNSNIEFTGTLRDIQLLYVELLRFVDNVCRKHNIEYWLDYGTLLGAVRHGGFIPWDDDLDIAMMRDDYNKLIDVLPKEISRFDYLKDNCGLTLLIENGKNYFDDFNDIYSLHEEGTDLIDTKVLFLQFALLKPYVKIDVYARDYLIEEKREYFEKHYRTRKYEFNQKVISGVYSHFEKLEELRKEFGLISEKTDLLTISFENDQLCEPHIHSTDAVFPLKPINFEGYEFYAPYDCESYLKVFYGPNFMSIPSSEYSHGMIPFVESQFNSKEEMKEFFETTLKKMKEINDTFH